MPLKFEMGEAFQFDSRYEWLMIGGIHRKILAAHLNLCASRAFLVAAYPTQSHEMLFDAHTRAFTALGGIPRRGIYDNMKTAVDRVCKGGGRIVNARFEAYRALLVRSGLLQCSIGVGEGHRREECPRYAPPCLDQCQAATLRSFR